MLSPALERGSRPLVAPMADAHDLIVIGERRRPLGRGVLPSGGLDRHRARTRNHLALPGVAGGFGHDVSYGETVVSVELQDDDLVVTTHRQCYRSRAVLVALRSPIEDWAPDIPA